MRWLSVLLLFPATAWAGFGAGGVTLSTENLGGIGPAGVLHAGAPLCLGGTGFEVDGHRRIGGEGQYCGNGRTQFTFGGAELGGQRNLLMGYGAATLGVGGGFIDVQDRDDGDRFRSGFAYARPELSAGIPVGIGAVELGLYAMIPVPLVQSLHGDMRPIASFATTGAEISFLFGDFRERRHPDAEPVAEVEPPPPAPPAPTATDDRAPIPGTVPMDSPPVQDPPPDAVGVEGEGEDARPLAIPATGHPPSR